MRTLFVFLLIAVGFLPRSANSQSGKQADWERTIELARKEGKVVVSIPASSELRIGIEKFFEKRYGIDVEPVVGRASAIVRKVVDETKAGVRYVDLHMGGSESVVTGMLSENILDPLEQHMLLPEVKDPKQWWGGHIWVDNGRRFIYSTLAYQSESLWFNPQLRKRRAAFGCAGFFNITTCPLPPLTYTPSLGVGKGATGSPALRKGA